MRKTRNPVRRLSALCLAILLVGCDDDPTDVEIVTGTYEAVSFVRNAAAHVDLMPEGADMLINLRADLQTTGYVWITAEANNGTQLTSDLTGMWTLALNSAVLVSTAQPTFLDDVTLLPGADRELVFQNEEYTIHLRKR